MIYIYKSFVCTAHKEIANQVRANHHIKLINHYFNHARGLDELPMPIKHLGQVIVEQAISVSSSFLRGTISMNRCKVINPSDMHITWAWLTQGSQTR